MCVCVCGLSNLKLLGLTKSCGVFWVSLMIHLHYLSVAGCVGWGGAGVEVGVWGVGGLDMVLSDPKVPHLS